MATTPDSTPANTSAGAAQQGANQQAGRDRRHRNRNRHGRGNGAPPTGPSRPKFIGDTPEMNGHVFECHGERASRPQFNKTLEFLESYVKKHLKFPEDLSPLFQTEMGQPSLTPPTRPVPLANGEFDGLELFDYQQAKKKFDDHEEQLRGNLAALFAVIWGQCSETMRSKLRALDRWVSASAANDCYWLLQQIRAIALQFDQAKEPVLSLLEAHRSFLTCEQKPHESVDEFMNNLLAWAEAIESFGGSIVESPTMRGEPFSSRSYAIARDRTLAMALISLADPERFDTLRVDLANAYVQRRDNYPKDLTSAYNLLVNFKRPGRPRPSSGVPRNNNNSNTASTPAPSPAPATSTTPSPSQSPEASAMTFTQVAEIVAGDDGKVYAHIQCAKCGRKGHFPNHCPSASGTTLVQYGVSLTQGDCDALDEWSILLDSQSTISVFKNAAMLTNIRASSQKLRALTNGGYQESCLVGDFPNLGPVWYNPESIANILSLADVRKVCRVTLDTGVEHALVVHRKDGSLMKFVESPSGLYVFSPNSSARVNMYSLLHTVAGQKGMFTKREVAAADAARELYRKIGRPSEQEFQEILRGNYIRNCPVTPDDARRALIIYGPDVATIKGKTHRTAAAARVPTFTRVPLPPPILEHHRDVTLCVDFFFVQRIPFFHCISRDIGYRTVTPVPDLTKKTILRECQSVIRLYTTRGFRVADLHCDNDFECIREDIAPIPLDVVPADSHVPEIERSVRTVKERLRSGIHGLPFKRVPKLLIVELVKHVTSCLNQFPHKDGVSATLSPDTIVTGRGNPDFSRLRVEFGSYVQAFEDNSPSNTPRARTLGAIALAATGNANGDFAFLSLATGERITRHHWIELPIPETAIARVEALALQEDRPLIQDSGLVIEWRPDFPIDPDDYDPDYRPRDTDDSDLDSVFLPIDSSELASLDGSTPNDPSPLGSDQGALFLDPSHDTATGPFDLIDDDRAPDHYAVHDTDDMYTDGDPNEPDTTPCADNVTHGDAAEEGAYQDEGSYYSEDAYDAPILLENEGAHDEPPPGHEGTNDNTIHPEQAMEDVPTHTYSLRPRTGTARLRFADALDSPHDGKSYYPPVQLFQKAITLPPANKADPTDAHRRIIHAFTMTQMSERAGLRKHGERAEQALLKEFGQLRDLSVFHPRKASDLTDEEKKGALRAINLIKEKRDGSLKGRTVADGRPQRKQYDKSETASPTVSSDALMATIMIDAKEGRDVATADVAGAYLNANMDDVVILKFTGKAVELICQTDANYEAYVTLESGRKALYVQLDKALYGCVRSALLWYQLFSETLQAMGFELNPYDPCVANCDINGSQCTIVWYVDDTKISHVTPEVVTAVIENIESSFGKMSVTRGTEHEFLGMKITFNANRTVSVAMGSYLREAIAEFGTRINRSASTPAKRTLFEVSEGAIPLSAERSEIFHRVSAKLLYVATRGRPDILLPTCFLCTRVSKCTEEDEEKLKRVLEYLKGTIDLEYVLGADDLSRMRTWVDASYAVHPDMKSHTGGVMSFGTGGLLCKSAKQKLNTKSSTEAELVGASDYLPNTIWMKMFLEAQGHKVVDSVLEQDNESAIKLEKNGRMSAGQKSRHINIRYFFIKDRLKSEGISVRHCPTLQMLADFFTKPLQGSLFVKLRDVIMGHKHMSSLDAIELPSSEERVGSWRPESNPSPTGEQAESGNDTTNVTDGSGVSSKAVTWAGVVRGVF